MTTPSSPRALPPLTATLLLSGLLLLTAAGCAQKEATTDTTTTASPVASGSAAVASTKGTPVSGDFKVGLVVPDPITDKGWAESADDGLKAIGKNEGATIGQPVENDTSTAFEGIFRNFAQQGNRLVFAHGEEYDSAAKTIAADTPDMVICVTGGRSVAANLMPIQFQVGEGTYLAGMLAAGMSKTETIGLIGPTEIPIIKQSFDAFEKGAKAVKPGIVVKRVFIGSTDTTKGKLAAETFLQSGVDVIMHNADDAGKGVAQAVSEKPGAMFIGANADQSDLATSQNLGSFILGVPDAMEAVARDVKAGTNLGQPYKGGLKDKAVGLVYNAKFAGTVPADLKAKIAQAEADIISGKIKVD